MANWWDEYEKPDAPTQQRGAWDRFKDSYLSAALHSPFGGEGAARLYFKHVKGYTDEQINEAEKRIAADLEQRQNSDPAFNGGSLQQGAVRGGVDLLGGLLGGADPSYAIAPGKTVAQRIAAQAGVNAGMDAISQGVELHRGVRDKFDPYEVGLNAAAGAVLQGGGEVVSKARTGRMIREGMKHPAWQDVNDVIVNDLEGGGTLDHPKTSKKGALGPQQVMPETARDPGFGIRRWDGKTQADLARVGRQYSAVMMSKYDGDPAKVLAAYNAGPGRVDHAIAKHGENWFDYLPNETKDYVSKGMMKLGGAANDTNGLQRGFPRPGIGVGERPIYPEDLGSIDDIVSAEMPSINEQASLNDALAPEESHIIDISNRFVDSETRQLNKSFVDPTSEHLTPAERQDLDASVERPIVDNTGYEAHTPNVGDPKTPANDPTKPGFVENFKNMIKDDSAAYKDPFDKLDTSRSYDELDPEGKLIKAVREARPISAEQRSLYRAARSERSGHIDKIQQEGRGLKGYHEQLKALKGSLPKADYESIAEHFSEEDVSHLLNKINNSKSLLPLEKIKTQTALMKLLGSEGAKAPTAGDIKLLSQVYSEDFVTALMDNRDFMQKFWHGVGSTVNIPRALMASYDLSAPLRQGIFFIGKKEYWKSFGHMFKLFGSEDASKALMENIRSRPTWAMMKKAGLAISDPHSHFLADREEAFMTDYAEKIPIAGLGVKASNRAYSGFLNKLRADVFDDYVRQYENIGVNLATDPRKLKEVASFINAATGRGSLGKWGNPAAPALASVFFSPRLIAARAQMFYPGTYIRTDPILRKEAIKSLLSFGAVAVTTAGLAKYGLGLDVEDDPTSADFMKIKVGNTRFDHLGGFQQYIRLGAELATGRATSSSGEEHDLTSGKFGQDTRRDVLEKFVINKFSPVASFFSDMLEGKNAVGQKFDVTRHNLDMGDDSIMKNDIMERFVPLVIQDIADGIKEWGAKGALVGVPAVFGVGVQTYKPKEPKGKKSANWWSEFEAKDEKAPTASTDWWKDYEK